MKHTYLYPLDETEGWLWLAARRSSTDLFGELPEGAPDAQWKVGFDLINALADARSLLEAHLTDRERVCIGRHHVIPESLDLAGTKRPNWTVRQITFDLWDAPILRGTLYANIYSSLKKTTGDGRDDWDTVAAFLKKYRDTRVIPVWM